MAGITGVNGVIRGADAGTSGHHNEVNMSAFPCCIDSIRQNTERPKSGYTLSKLHEVVEYHIVPEKVSTNYLVTVLRHINNHELQHTGRGKIIAKLKDCNIHATTNFVRYALQIARAYPTELQQKQIQQSWDTTRAATSISSVNSLNSQQTQRLANQFLTELEKHYPQAEFKNATLHYGLLQAQPSVRITEIMLRKARPGKKVIIKYDDIVRTLEEHKPALAALADSKARIEYLYQNTVLKKCCYRKLRKAIRETNVDIKPKDIEISRTPSDTPINELQTWYDRTKDQPGMNMERLDRQLCAEQELPEGLNVNAVIMLMQSDKGGRDLMDKNVVRESLKFAKTRPTPMQSLRVTRAINLVIKKHQKISGEVMLIHLLLLLKQNNIQNPELMVRKVFLEHGFYISRRQLHNPATVANAACSEKNWEKYRKASQTIMGKAPYLADCQINRAKELVRELNAPEITAGEIVQYSLFNDEYLSYFAVCAAKRKKQAKKRQTTEAKNSAPAAKVAKVSPAGIADQPALPKKKDKTPAAPPELPECSFVPPSATQLKIDLNDISLGNLALFTIEQLREVFADADEK